MRRLHSSALALDWMDFGFFATSFGAESFNVKAAKSDVDREVKYLQTGTSFGPEGLIEQRPSQEG